MTQLPVHPTFRHPRTGEPLRAIYRFRDGRLAWPILGASSDDPGNPPAGDPPKDPPPADSAKDEGLGDAGKKALQEERARVKAAEKEKAALAAKLKEYEDRDKTEAEKLAAQAEAAEKRAATATARAVKAEVKALADGFADREDAVLNLGDLSQYVTDGEVDLDAITEALGKVLERKPHLGKATGPRNPAPDPSQGARGGQPADTDALIREAQTKGDWKAVIRLQNQKLNTTQK